MNRNYYDFLTYEQKVALKAEMDRGPAQSHPSISPTASDAQRQAALAKLHNDRFHTGPNDIRDFVFAKGVEYEMRTIAERLQSDLSA